MKKIFLSLCCMLCAVFLTAGCGLSASVPQSSYPPGTVREAIDAWLSDITREQGEQYVSVLKKGGFREIAADSEPASAGIALCKDTIHLGVSISDGALGLYISFAS